MNPEEYLDRLIERREHGGAQLPVINDEIAASVAAAEMLAQLREIDVPPAFADHLELQIRAHARNLARQTSATIPIVRPWSPAGPQRSLVRKTLITMLGIAAMLMVACVGVLTASASSLPGDALYSLKQAENQFTLTFASNPNDRVSVQIEQVQSSLIDLNTVVNGGRDDEAIRLALDTVAAKTNDSRGAVAALPAGSEREAAQRELDGVLAEEEQTLRHLLDQVDWPIRVALTQQLGALGDPVPTVTHVTERTQSNGTLLITMTGTHFAPNVTLIIDGRPGGVVSVSTPGQLVAVISASTWSVDDHAFGVLNPDGTAAQIMLDGDGHEPDQQGSDHSRYSTPTPNGHSRDD